MKIKGIIFHDMSYSRTGNGEREFSFFDESHHRLNDFVLVNGKINELSDVLKRYMKLHKKKFGHYSADLDVSDIIYNSDEDPFHRFSTRKGQYLLFGGKTYDFNESQSVEELFVKWDINGGK